MTFWWESDNSTKGCRAVANRTPVLIIAVIVFLLFGGLSFLVDLYFDFLWFQELEKEKIFTTILYAKGSVATATILIVFVFVYLNLMWAFGAPGQIEFGIPTPNGQITAYTLPEEQLRRGLGLVSLLVGVVLGMRMAARWEVVLQWLNREDFNVSDPVFGHDISFYFFTLPVADEVVRIALLLCFLSAAGAMAIYHFKGVLSVTNLSRPGRVSYHASFLAALAFLILACDAYLDRFQLLYSNQDTFFGATHADLHARMPMLTAQVVIAVLAAVLLLYNAFAATYRPALGAMVLYLLVLVAGRVYPAFIQRFVVDPNELSRESPQIEHNIEATIQAYGLAQVQEANLSGDKPLTPGDIESNAATIRNIRLWDHEPLLDTFSQIQEIRTYYNFLSVSNDRYTVDGQMQQMMLSVRELDSTSLPERNWINENLKFTHGYGLTLGPVNQLTLEGLPVLLVKDIPPSSQKPEFQIQQPEIYYGEQSHGYIIVGTEEEEFDYPAGDENVYSSYQGSGGISSGTFLRKLLFAFYFRDANIILSPLLNEDSRILFNRDIRTRIGKLVPFLQLDSDPYMVISEGKLKWIQDAYTVGERYPYSRPTPGVGNYIRNSVKIVLDAYHGSVDLFVADPDDPLIRVYQSIFPGVFRPLSEISEDLRAHLRYPEDIFSIQTFIYSEYHMNNPQVFYNKEDRWEIPVIRAATGGDSVMSPYYTIMRLPKEEKEEFILMLPFTPARKDNLSAWMVARSDAEHYGQLAVYRFPKQKLVYGPKQIVGRINQDAEISRQISLWDQRGSQVIQGTLLVIPIEEALVYVRPLYLRAESGKIPELKRVIVAYENKIAMAENLEKAFEVMFSGDASPPDLSRPAPTTTRVVPEARPASAPGKLPQQAGDAYARAIRAQRNGDWAAYGEEIRRLGEIIEELKDSPSGAPEQ